MNKLINIFEGFATQQKEAIYEKAVSNGNLTKAVRVFAKSVNSKGEVSSFYIVTYTMQHGKKQVGGNTVLTSQEVSAICKEFFADVDLDVFK